MGEFFSAAWDRIINFDIAITDILDMAIVAFVIYKVLRYLRRTNSANVFKGVLLLVAFLWLSSILELNVVNFLLGKTVELGVLALVVLFQPEIRQALSRMGNNSLIKLFSTNSSPDQVDTAITQTVLAASQMSMTRTGALIVFERKIRLDEIVRTGSHIDAQTSAELLKNIFFHNSPLHDGAVIVRDGRILSAACVLPNSQKSSISKDLGTRHRAAVGASENSDAVVVVVSEETGAISVAVDGMLKRHLSPETLEQILVNELKANFSDKNRLKLIESLKVILDGKKDKN